MSDFDGLSGKREVVIGVAGAIRYPRLATPYLGAGTANAAQSRLLGSHKVLIHGYCVEVPAAARIVCVGGDGTTEIGGTGITLVAGSLPGFYEFPGGCITWEPPAQDTLAVGAGANFAISCGAGITASAIFTDLG